MKTAKYPIIWYCVLEIENFGKFKMPFVANAEEVANGLTFFVSNDI